ncbi:hypothetical protein N9746_08070 [Candidatus Thioglobus sp.]|nr:hypothetical protein [Candidatus Thioglobus sp.]
MKKLLLILFISFGTSVLANSITYTPTFGNIYGNGYVGSNGTTYTPTFGNSYGKGLSGSDGTECIPDFGGGMTCTNNSSNSYNISNPTGWGAITNSMSGIGSNIGKSFGSSNRNSGSNYNPQMDKFMEEIRKAQEANSFKPPVQFSGKWKEVTSSKDGSTTFYIDTETLMRGGDSVFYWQLNDNSKPDPFGDRSAATYNQADCNLMSYKQLTLTTFKQQMARQLTKVIDYLPAKEWTYTKPGYINESIVEEVCGKNIIPVEEEEVIWLTCRGDITINFDIYPKTKEFRLYKGKKKYTEEGDFISFIDFIDHPEEDIKEWLKVENRLNRITGEFIQTFYKKSKSFSFDSETKELYLAYEPSGPNNIHKFRCSKEDPLF